MLKKAVVGLVAGLLAVILAGSAQAVLITTGGTGAGGDAFLQISQDVSFTITEDFTGFLAFIIDDAFAVPDAEGDASSVSGLSYQVNQGTSTPIDLWYEHPGASSVDVTVSDSLLLYMTAPESVVIGDVVTLSAGTLNMNGGSVPGFSVFPSGDYDMFLANGTTGDQISGLGAVPEPATAGLLGISFGALWIFRRVKNHYRF